MYCGKCGAQISDDARFCRECGQPVVRMQSKAQSMVDQEQIAQAAARGQEHGAQNEAAGLESEAQNEAVRFENEPQNKTSDSTDRNKGTNWVRLVGAFANGTEEQRNEAFTALYNASYNQVYAHVMRYARDEEKANDAVQNAYIACWGKIDQLGNAAQFLPWIKRIAYNEFLMTVRKDAKVVDFGVRADDEGNETPAEEFLSDDTLPMPEDAYASEELHRLLLQSIDELSDAQRIVLKGFYYENKPMQTLADELGVPLNTIKTHLSRGRKNLATRAASYANAYGLKLVPVAVIPFMAMLAEQDVQACEIAAAAAGGSSVLIEIMAVVSGKFSAGAAAGAAGGAAGSAGAVGGSATGTAAGAATASGVGGTSATGAGAATATSAGSAVAGSVGSASAVGGSATGAAAATTVGSTAAAGSATAGASAVAGTGSVAAGAATAASGIAVKAGIGVAVAALAAGGGYGAYRYVHQEPVPVVSEEPQVPEEVATEATEESVEEVQEEVETASAEERSTAQEILNLFLSDEYGIDYAGEYKTMHGVPNLIEPAYAISDINGDGDYELYVADVAPDAITGWVVFALDNNDLQGIGIMAGYDTATDRYLSYNDFGVEFYSFDGQNGTYLGSIEDDWEGGLVQYDPDYNEVGSVTQEEYDAAVAAFTVIEDLVEYQPLTQENVDALTTGDSQSAVNGSTPEAETTQTLDKTADMITYQGVLNQYLDGTLGAYNLNAEIIGPFEPEFAIADLNKDGRDELYIKDCTDIDDEYWCVYMPDRDDAVSCKADTYSTELEQYCDAWHEHTYEFYDVDGTMVTKAYFIGVDRMSEDNIEWGKHYGDGSSERISEDDMRALQEKFVPIGDLTEPQALTQENVDALTK